MIHFLYTKINHKQKLVLPLSKNNVALSKYQQTLLEATRPTKKMLRLQTPAA
jgi:hypothetical protein